jgi:hypothetical protein
MIYHKWSECFQHIHPKIVNKVLYCHKQNEITISNSNELELIYIDRVGEFISSHLMSEDKIMAFVDKENLKEFKNLLMKFL